MNGVEKLRDEIVVPETRDVDVARTRIKDRVHRASNKVGLVILAESIGLVAVLTNAHALARKRPKVVIESCEFYSFFFVLPVVWLAKIDPGNISPLKSS